jgi:hypothetical protein
LISSDHQSEPADVGCYKHVFVVSDVHYAGAAEQARRDYRHACISSPTRRLITRLYRRFLWLHDPFAHNHLLDRFLAAASDADLVVANGDYSCDSAFIGVADPAAFQSAEECLGKLRARFGENLHATIGDHELGKKALSADAGGLHLGSYHRTTEGLALKRFWQIELGNYVLMGVTSSLLALAVLESEAQPEDIPAWRELRAQHIEEITRAFGGLDRHRRVLLFCHDPSALPYLAELPNVREKLPQIERTIIGHLHSDLILFNSRFLCGMPAINFLGHTPKRISSALRLARHWKPFNLFLCPSLAGIQLLKDGGYCSVQLDPAGKAPARFKKHRLAWQD